MHTLLQGLLAMRQYLTTNENDGVALADLPIIQAIILVTAKTASELMDFMMS
jgi:hypothetical protein